jgi:FkbM family methyltransferase
MILTRPTPLIMVLSARTNPWMRLVVTAEGALLRRWPFSRGRWWLRRQVAGHLQVILGSGDWIRVSGVSEYEWQAVESRAAKEDATIRVVSQIVRPGDTVLDVGANIGLFSLIASRAVGRDGAVHAFEPGRAAYARLGENLRINGTANVITHATAVADQNGWTSLFISDDSEASSLLQVAPSHDSTEHIEVCSLDHFVATSLDEAARRRIALIKVDVEGSEVAVFRGAQNLLTAPTRPAIIVEANPVTLAAAGESTDSLREILQTFNYSIEVIESIEWSGAVVQNWLCIP